MKASLFCFLVLAFLLPSLAGFSVVEHVANHVPTAQSLKEYFEPGDFVQEEPMEIKQIIGFVIAGLASVVILLFVFSFLMGPGEKIRAKVSETADPFFTIRMLQEWELMVIPTCPPTLPSHDRSLHRIVRIAPGRTRTCDRRIRNPVLYPTELPA